MSFETKIICDDCKKEVNPLYDSFVTDYEGKYLEDIRHRHKECPTEDPNPELLDK